MHVLQSFGLYHIPSTALTRYLLQDMLSLPAAHSQLLFKELFQSPHILKVSSPAAAIESSPNAQLGSCGEPQQQPVQGHSPFKTSCDENVALSLLPGHESHVAS